MKKNKEPYPTVITNMPKEEIDKPLKGDEDKSVKEKIEKTKKKGRTGTRKVLTPDQVSMIIEQWDNKSMTEFAKGFDVSLQVVSNMVKEIHKQDETLCPPKTTRADIAKAGIALFKKKQSKK